MLGCLPAHGQGVPALLQDVPELEGGPGSRPVAKPAPAKPQAKPKTAPQTAQKPSPPAASRLKADEARLAEQVAAQKVEQTRLAQQAADLKSREAALDARAAELAAEEKRLAQLRTDQEAQLAARQAELTRQLALASERQQQTAERDRDDDKLPEDSPDDRSPIRAALDLDAARRSCTLAGEDAAIERRFYSARYDSAPRFYEGRVFELRGLMRLEDRRGYMLVDTTCEVDADGEVQHFAFLR